MNTNVSSNASNTYKHDKRTYHFLRLNEERMVYAMSCLVDKEVTVSLESGDQLKGSFSSFDPSSRGTNKAIDIALTTYLPSNGNTENKSLKPMIIHGNEYHYFSSQGISKNLFKTKDSKVNHNKKPTQGKFKTDSEISSTKVTKVNSVLTEWRSTEGTSETQLMDLDKTEGVEWDQFETNTREYGVVSTFDENLYTTSLNLNEIPQSVKDRAELIAAEIENSGENNYSQIESMLEDEDVANQENYTKSTKENKKKDKLTHPPKSKGKQSYQNSMEKQEQFTQGRSNKHISSDLEKTELHKHPQAKNKHEKHLSQQIGVNALNIEPTNPKETPSQLSTERKPRHLEHDKVPEKPTYQPSKLEEKLPQPQLQLQLQPQSPVPQPKQETKVEVEEERAEEHQETRMEPILDLAELNHELEKAKKSFKFNPNASTFTPSLMTDKQPRELDHLSSKSSSPMGMMPRHNEFRAFKSLNRFPRLDLRRLKTERGKMYDHTYDEKWPANASLSYRDLLGDLTSLQPQQAMPMRTPNHMVHPNQMPPMMMPQPQQLPYPPYALNPAIPVSMMQYPGQVPPRFYNGVQYNQIMQNQVMNRRNQMQNASANAQYGHMNLMANNHYAKSKSNDFDEKNKGYINPKQSSKK